MSDLFEGYYARFSTVSKKKASVLIGADCLVGDKFIIEFVVDKGKTVSWIKNKFGELVGYFDDEVSHRLRIALSRGWNLNALLSYVAFTDQPEPGFYWGEALLLCYPKNYEPSFACFTDRVSELLQKGIRPDISMGTQGAEQILSLKGEWTPLKRMPPREKIKGTVVIKSRRKLFEKVIELGRAKKKGCYFISILFIVIIIVLILFLINLWLF